MTGKKDVMKSKLNKINIQQSYCLETLLQNVQTLKIISEFLTSSKLQI